MSDRGFIKLNRRLFEHRLWCQEREFSTFEAWLDLIKSARFEDATQNIGKYQSQSVKRGQMLASVRFLAQRWGWSTKKVLRFLRYLEIESMISKKTSKETGITIITLLNYDVYNNKSEPKETPEETPKKHQENTGETNIKNYKELKKNNTPLSPLPPLAKSQRAPHLSPAGKSEIASLVSVNDINSHQTEAGVSVNDISNARQIQNPNRTLPSGENYCQIPR